MYDFRIQNQDLTVLINSLSSRTPSNSTHQFACPHTSPLCLSSALPKTRFGPHQKLNKAPHCSRKSKKERKKNIKHNNTNHYLSGSHTPLWYSAGPDKTNTSSTLLPGVIILRLCLLVFGPHGQSPTPYADESPSYFELIKFCSVFSSFFFLRCCGFSMDFNVAFCDANGQKSTVFMGENVLEAFGGATMGHGMEKKK